VEDSFVAVQNCRYGRRGGVIIGHRIARRHREIETCP
jgi:hypothetical protein